MIPLYVRPILHISPYKNNTELCADQYKNNADQEKTNAALIAAAPELLEALTIALDRLIENNCDTDDEYEFTSIIRAAIAKAKGSAV